MNPYLDINYVDRTEEIKKMFDETLEDMRNDPCIYAEVVNDLLFHWVYGTRETELMHLFKKNIIKIKALNVLSEVVIFSFEE